MPAVLLLTASAEGVASADFAVQVGAAFASLGRALAAEGAAARDVVQLRTYLVDAGPRELALVREARRRFFAPGAAPAAMTQVVSGTSVPGMRIVVDAVVIL